MSHSLLQHSMFHEVLLPVINNDNAQKKLKLRRSMCFYPEKNTILSQTPLVVFDFETTGLDHNYDRIIEVGAQKIIGNKVVDQLETLIAYEGRLSPIVQKLTGINPKMLLGKPLIQSIIPKILQFIHGSILVAHNASFDMAFLKAECSRVGIDLNWPAFCTLKIARNLLAELERKNLDSLAQHYGLQFEARHRSIGDVKVTVAVLNKMLATKGQHLVTWEDMAAYAIV